MPRSHVVAVLGCLAAALALDGAQAQGARSPSPPGASVFFVEPQPGATVGTRFKVRFGISGMEVVPAGTAKAHSGHHHIIIDTDLPPFDERIPADFNHLHFGSGQTEAELTLPPGDHTLQLLFADHDHVPHDPPIVSKELHIRVVEGGPAAAPAPSAAAPAAPATPAASGAEAAAPAPVAPAPAATGRRPSPPGASVYFIYPQDGAVIYPRSTIRFGLKGMGVAPAGVAKDNTGHHHLLVDVETPPLDQPLPNDFNHIHLGKGQTERRIELPPGKHTLQLVFADEHHVPHDPPVVSPRITVTVKGRPAGDRRKGTR